MPKISWSKQLVVEKIHELNKLSGKINSKHAKTNSRKLYGASCRLFGTWEKAVEAAGFDYSKVRTTKSRRPTNALNSKAKVISEILRRQKEGLSLNGTNVLEEDQFLYQMACNFFGKKGWQKALRASGINPDSVQKIFWTKKKIQKTIRKLIKEKSPLYPVFLQQNGLGGLYTASFHFFGGWKLAVESCGLNYEHVRGCVRKWTPKLVIKEIIALKKRGVRLNVVNVQKINRSLVDAAYRYFGDWGQSVEIAGLSYRKESIRWTYKAWLKTLDPKQLEVIDKQAKEFGLKMRRRRHEYNRQGNKKT